MELPQCRQLELAVMADRARDAYWTLSVQLRCVKLCSKRLSFVRNQMLTEMLRTTGPGTHFKLALTSESDRQTSKFPDPYFENILFST